MTLREGLIYAVSLVALGVVAISVWSLAACP